MGGDPGRYNWRQWDHLREEKRPAGWRLGAALASPVCTRTCSALNEAARGPTRRQPRSVEFC